MPIFKKILIANRGEIALRAIRACKELGIPSLLAHSKYDRDSLGVRYADEAVQLPYDSTLDAYLNIDAIIRLANNSGADAIYPGYGYLSENDKFAEACESNDIVFIGPAAKVIRDMGNKSLARKIMIDAGVPVVPGSDGYVRSPRRAAILAEKIGYPVILKASAGGGGKGMRLAYDVDGVFKGFSLAGQESKKAFNDDKLYLEKYIERARHIEIQIIADSYGNTVYLGERECSIQRRHQKLIEESPSPALDDTLRREMGEHAVKAAQHVGYRGAGTVEYIFDNGKYYFMEMNTRIQVEHPISEITTGVDLVREQILVASGRPLSFSQKDIEPKGHAIECRINAEDPENDFIPDPGEVTEYIAPGGIGVRIDSFLYPGCVISPYYDSMIAKLIVHAHDRPTAIARMQRALSEYVINGVHTTIPVHQRILKHPDFQRGDFFTDFVPTKIFPPKQPIKAAEDDLIIPPEDLEPPDFTIGAHGCFDDDIE